MRILSVAVLAVAGMVFVSNADDAQVNEAAAVFDGVKGAPPVNSGNGVIRLKHGGSRLWP